MELATLLGRPPPRKKTPGTVDLEFACSQLMALPDAERARAFDLLLTRPVNLGTLKLAVACVTSEPRASFDRLESALPSLAAAMAHAEDPLRTYFFRALLRWQADPLLCRLRTLVPATAVLAGRCPKPAPLTDADILAAGRPRAPLAAAPPVEAADAVRRLCLELFGGGGDGETESGLLADVQRRVSELWLCLEAAGVPPPREQALPAAAAGGAAAAAVEDVLEDEDGVALVEDDSEEAAPVAVVGGGAAADGSPDEMDADGECWVGTVDAAPAASVAERRDGGKLTSYSIAYGADGATDADILAVVSAGGGWGEEVLALEVPSESTLDPELRRSIADALRSTQGLALPALRQARASLHALDADLLQGSDAPRQGTIAAAESLRRKALPVLDRLVREIVDAADAARRLGVVPSAGRKAHGLPEGVLSPGPPAQAPYASASLRGRILQGRRGARGRGRSRGGAQGAPGSRPPAGRSRIGRSGSVGAVEVAGAAAPQLAPPVGDSADGDDRVALPQGRKRDRRDLR